MEKRTFWIKVWGGIFLPCLFLLPAMLFAIISGVATLSDSHNSLYEIFFLLAGFGGLIAFIGVIMALFTIHKKEVLSDNIKFIAWIGRAAALTAVIALPIPLLVLAVGLPFICSFSVIKEYDLHYGAQH